MGEHAPQESWHAPVARASRALAGHFAGGADVFAVAPGRVNLIGEHIDYSGGHVLPFAIDLWCASAARWGSDAGRVRVHAADIAPGGETVVVSADAAAAIARGDIRRGSWGSYAAGVVDRVRARLLACNGLDVLKDRGIEIAVSSDVPSGGGLSSSAAFEVAIASAMYGLACAPGRACALADVPDAAWIPSACIAAERTFAGVPCGIMDQLASFHGRAGRAILIDTRAGEESPNIRAVPLPERASLVVIDTGVRHKLGASEYPLRRAASEAAAKALGVRWLCEATLDALEVHAGLSAAERDAATHAINEEKRVVGAAAALRSGSLAEVGRLMVESHASLRDVYRVSCAELDCVVRVLMKSHGVLGARMTGGGFGGCVIAMLEEGSAEAALQNVQREYRSEFGVECTMRRVTTVNGASLVLPGA